MLHPSSAHAVQSALLFGLRETIRRSPLGDARGWVQDFEALAIRTLERTPADVSLLSGAP